MARRTVGESPADRAEWARSKGKPAVLMSLEDFSAWEETAYLLRSQGEERGQVLQSNIKVN